MPVTEDLICPKGHISTEAEYCSECGVRLTGTTGSVGSHGAGCAMAAAQVCPACTATQEEPSPVFCEICGFQFEAGAHGPALLFEGTHPVDAEVTGESSTPTVPHAASQLPDIPQGAMGVVWVISLEKEIMPGAADGKQPAQSVPPAGVILSKAVSLIGRSDRHRGVEPEIDLAQDEAVSRRHALLLLEGSKLCLRDIRSSNGTQLNGTELVSLTDYPLQSGDLITLGRESRLRIGLRS